MALAAVATRQGVSSCDVVCAVVLTTVFTGQQPRPPCLPRLRPAQPRCVRVRAGQSPQSGQRGSHVPAAAPSGEGLSAPVGCACTAVWDGSVRTGTCSGACGVLCKLQLFLQCFERSSSSDSAARGAAWAAAAANPHLHVYLECSSPLLLHKGLHLLSILIALFAPVSYECPALVPGTALPLLFREAVHL